MMSVLMESVQRALGQREAVCAEGMGAFCAYVVSKGVSVDGAGMLGLAVDDDGADAKVQKAWGQGSRCR